MKKTIATLALLCTVVGASAQDNGYRGFADIGYTAGIGDYKFGRTEISTTHGYQVNPYFFIGGGVGFHFMNEYATNNAVISLDERSAKTSIPVFADFRVTFSQGKVAPFVDLKLGHFVNNNDGFYGNLSAGLRFKLNGNQGLSVSVGYTNEQLEMWTFHDFIDSSSLDYIRRPNKCICEGISFKVGYEF